MVGREISNIYGRRDEGDKISEQYLEVRNLSLKDKFRDISFSLYKGEILGISGLVGAGRTEMGMTIFGVTPRGKRRDLAGRQKNENREPAGSNQK